MANKKHYLYKINTFNDEDGSLNVIEENKQVPFKIRRVFYERDVTKLSKRGNHANIYSRFCLIAVSGSCDVIVEDGDKRKIYNLDKPNKILFIDRMIWKTMTNFSDNCVLLILSDNLYDKDEYIRDFNLYLELRKAKKFI